MEEYEMPRMIPEDEGKLAQKMYKKLSDENPDLRTGAFLKLFNKLTEDQRDLIPENYPITQKDFQIKIMYEKHGWDKTLNRRPLNNKIMD